jgi:predicted flap endonuclease-1-like 5' DNA nuclease
MSAGKWVEVTEPDDAYELQEHEYTFEPDEELVALAQGISRTRAAPPPPPLGRRSAADPRSRHGSGVFSRPEPAAPRNEPPSSGELARLSAQLRARDAYLAELERELEARTRQLALAGIRSLNDVARLQGRLRGQAFRIAELEAELACRSAAAAADSGETAPGADLRRIRGIGPRYAAQLAALGVHGVAQLAIWSDADVARVAAQLRISPGRIARESWVAQARSLCGT